MQAPHLWLLLGLVIWGIILVWQAHQLATKQEENEVGWATTKIVLKQPINLDALDDYISYRTVISEEVVYTQDYAVVKATWVEYSSWTWGGYKPLVTLEYDDDNGYVYSAYIKYSTREGSLKASQLKQTLVDLLVDENVIPPPDQEEEQEMIEQ